MSEKGKHEPVLIALIAVAALVYMGCMWQIEIAYINICNGWDFGFLFTWLIVDNWAAKDFFYLLQCVSLVVAVIAAYCLGRGRLK